MGYRFHINIIGPSEFQFFRVLVTLLDRQHLCLICLCSIYFFTEVQHPTKQETPEKQEENRKQKTIKTALFEERDLPICYTI